MTNGYRSLDELRHAWGKLDSNNPDAIILIEAGCCLVQFLVPIDTREQPAHVDVMARLLFAATEDMRDICALAMQDRMYGVLRLCRPMFEKVVTCFYIESNPNKAEQFINYQFKDGDKFFRALKRRHEDRLPKQIVDFIDYYSTLKESHSEDVKPCETCGAKPLESFKWSKATPEEMAKSAKLEDLYHLYYSLALLEIHPSYFWLKAKEPMSWNQHQKYILVILAQLLDLAKRLFGDNPESLIREPVFLSSLLRLAGYEPPAPAPEA